MKATLLRPLVLSVCLASMLGAGLGAQVIEQVLLKVNGEIFTKTDLEARQVAALRSMGRDATPRPNDAELRKLLDDITPQLMVSVVNEMLLVQRGKELGYSLSDEQFKGIVDNIRKENKIETDEAFEAALKQENVTKADLRKTLERQMMVSNVTRNEVQAKITVSQDEMRRYYDAHMKDFSTSPKVTLREILVLAPAGSGSTPAETAARTKAEAVRARAAAGEGFEKLVTESSEAPSRANGGLIGPLSLDDLAPQIRETIETLKVGEMTAVLRTGNGYQILKLESMSARETKAFDDAKDQINERVYTEKERTEQDKHMEKLRLQSIIEFKSPDLKKAYEIGLEQMKNAPVQ